MATDSFGTEQVMLPFAELGHRGQVGRLRRLAVEALAAYDLLPVHLAPLGRGDNAAFRVETAGGQRYVLRIHRVGGNPWHAQRSAADVALRLLQLILWFLEMRDDPAFSDWDEEVQGLLAELKA